MEDYDAGMLARKALSLALAILFVIVLGLAVKVGRAQDAASIATGNLTSAQILDQMERHSLVQKQGLKQYQSLRHYQVEYRGFSTRIEARMDVEVNYSLAAGKTFRIVSEGGSGLLREKVLKRALDSEREATQDARSSALTQANYRFKLEGSDLQENRPAYIFEVEPVTPSKFLIRGKIWVDAADFAVVKMETQPAKNPSFWISQTRIHYTGAKTDGFWFPQQVLSETKVRIGGTAVLTINYGPYEVSPATTADAQSVHRDLGIAGMASK
jgi:outer membrane lipoprotein-sorting protein